MRKADAIRACANRHLEHYRRHTSHTFWQTPEDRERRRKLLAWFAARLDYLNEEYRIAINEDDSIIGKQWEYDRRPQMSNYI